MTPQSDVELAPFSTMHVGGPARWFFEAHSESHVVNALQWAAARDLSVHILGGGSNIVVSDAGFDGLVIKVSMRGVDFRSVGSQTIFDVAAGEPWDPLVARTVELNCAGVECLSGIPGLVGGTPVQNVGAYGQDVSGVITRVHVVDRRRGQPIALSNEDCVFGYRTSRFKGEDAGRFVVTRVEFALTPGGKPTISYADLISSLEQPHVARPSLADVRDAVLQIRRRKGMVIEDDNPANRSCGSFFVNPVVPAANLCRVRSISGSADVPHFALHDKQVKIPAAWLIERAGFPRGFTRGRVGISPFQSQAIINLGGATAGDVLALAGDVKRAVWNTFGISLVPEPVFVGFPPSSDVRWLITHLRADAHEAKG